MIVDYAATAALLLERAPEILRRWEAQVLAEIPASREQQRLALRNNLSQLLAEVSRSLSPTGQAQTMIEGLTLSEDHGGHRASLTDYEIGAVFLEYRLLRRVILEVLQERVTLCPDEREIILDSLERATQGAVSEFARVQHRVQRAAADAAETAAAEVRVAYEREHRIAQLLQRPLLLDIDEDGVDGVSLATLYEPAWEEAEVGGDFFDVIPLAGNRVALVVGDTCGKGLEAAVHNTHVKDVLRAFLRESPWHPGAVLSRLNDVVCDVLETGTGDPYRFVTLSLLILHTVSGDALFSSAGAEPLLTTRANGGYELLERPGLPLGIQHGVAYVDTATRLEIGDTALLFTDGIIEARHDGEMLGYDGIARLALDAMTSPTLQAAGHEILAGTRAFAGGNLQDDVCLILARRR